MKNSFLTIVEFSIIPCLKKMEEDELKHLSYLRGVSKINVSRFVKNSEEHLKGIRHSLDEYEVYLRDNKNDQL